MVIVITAGGTLGHINPALSLIKEIQNKYQDAKIYYVGKRSSMEEKKVKELPAISFIETTCLGFSKNMLRNIKAIYVFIKEVRRMKKILTELNCQLVIGTGGNITGSVLYAAAKLKIPTAIHEQNAVKGITNAFLSKRVRLIFSTFPNEYLKFPAEKTIVTGNPRTQEEEILPSGLELVGNKKIIMIAGGSLGAKVLNEAARELIETSRAYPWFFVFITGEKYYSSYQDLSHSLNNCLVISKTDKFLSYLNECDCIISRAGATTIAEIIALEKSSILIPSPNVSRNHQEKNAQLLVEKKAALMIAESDLNVTLLKREVERLLTDKVINIENLRALKITRPAEKIVEEAFKLIKMEV
ncbi:MAG: UDP-N-acetylglucosamine--N-acetylmuramyl-(pentapeptide) pyrophosphoryl-undecaprenol N-acetylglucosamine transferase [Erysipelotrichales bacterium]|nr:UDP-N-acetylglucosamine--N-acetylmuramyl-(pentapeptide) pyrophosphoryl-undecaprenol N-acetylglucosamine transferase [Erysipelotrichales bacterium]